MKDLYKEAIEQLFNLENNLSDRQREELQEILAQAYEALPPELIQSLKEITAQLLKEINQSKEDHVTDSYLRDL